MWIILEASVRSRYINPCPTLYMQTDCYSSASFSASEPNLENILLDSSAVLMKRVKRRFYVAELRDSWHILASDYPQKIRQVIILVATTSLVGLLLRIVRLDYPYEDIAKTPLPTLFPSFTNPLWRVGGNVLHAQCPLGVGCCGPCVSVLFHASVLTSNNNRSRHYYPIVRLSSFGFSNTRRLAQIHRPAFFLQEVVKDFFVGS